MHSTHAQKGTVKNMNHITIGFIGLGLIGGSIARAVKATHPNYHIIVYTRRKNPALETGVREGIINQLVYKIDETLTACDFIFLCAPVLNNIAFLSQLKEILSERCIITDVGSVKGNIHKEVVRLGMEKNFIGGHPMAGSEKTGYANSSAVLLKHSYYLLTPTNRTSRENLERLLTLLSCTESIPLILDPSKHDDITAAISHVPHIIAAALVNMVRTCDDENEYMKSFAAGGFKDITRIASSSAEMWESICLSNKESISVFLDKFIQGLQDIQKDINEENSKNIVQFFQNAGDFRNSLPDRASLPSEIPDCKKEPAQ